MRNADLKNHAPLGHYNRARAQIDLQGIAAPCMTAEMQVFLSIFNRF